MQEAITQLQRHLKAVQSKRTGWAVGLWGEAGVGKTFTVQTLLRESPIKSLSLHSTTSLQSLAQSLPRPDKLPLWARHILERQEQNQVVQTQSLMDALVATLSHLAPFVLHLEDIHEVGGERLEWIQKLAGSLSGLRGVGLLVTSRSMPPDPFKSHRLEALDPTQLKTLLENQAQAKLPQDGLDWVFERTKGNPLFALEFWRYLRRQSFFWSDGLDWHWRPPPGSFLAVSVEALILEMVKAATNSSISKAVLEARALFSAREPDPALWSRVAEVDQDTLAEALQALSQKGLLTSQGFGHPLIREVVVQEIAPAHKQGYARRAIEGLGKGDPEWAAEFIELAGVEATQALTVLEKAAETAATRGDSTSQARWLAKAVGWSHDDKAKRAMQAALALRLIHFEQAIHMAQIAAGETPPNPEAVFLLAELQANQGLVLEAEQTLARLPQSEEVKFRWWETSIWVGINKPQEVVELWNRHQGFQHRASPRIRRAVGHSLAVLGRLDEAQTLADQIAPFSLSPPDQIGLLNLRALIQSALGNRQAAIELNQQNLALCRSTGQIPNAIGTALNLSSSLDRLGNRAQSQALLEEAKTLAMQIASTELHGIIQMRLAMFLLDQAKYEQAEGLMLESQMLLRNNTNLTWRTENHLKMARLYLTWLPPHGLPLARKYASAAVELARQSHDTRFLISGLSHLARTECLLGQPVQALSHAQEALELARQKSHQPNLAMALQAYGLALEASGQKKEALEAIQQAIGHEDEEPMIQRYGLEADRMTDDLGSARKRYEWFVAQGLHALAQMALRYFPQLADQPDEAVPVAQPSGFCLKVLGEVSMEQTGGRPAFRSKTRLAILCYLLEARIAGKREVEVLELVDALYPEMPEAQGKSNLQKAVYFIRTDLGAQSVESTPGGYALGAVDSDVEQFLKTGDSGLWRGPYLQGLSDGWNANVRDGLVLALRSKVEALLAAEPAEAARLGGIWLDMEPYDRDALRLTIQALRARGNLKAAERAYRQGQERLIEVGEVLPEGLEEFLKMVVA